MCILKFSVVFTLLYIQHSQKNLLEIDFSIIMENLYKLNLDDINFK